MKKLVIFFFILFLSCYKDTNFRLQEIEIKKIGFAKPTGIFFSFADTAFFITTADGVLAKCDKNLQTIKSKQFEGHSFSHIYLDEFYIYLISTKGLIKIDKYSMELVSRIQLSNLGVKFNEVKGLYFNPIEKTFDVVVQEKKNTKVINYNPIDFKKIKVKKLPKIKKVDCAFYSFKYLYVIENQNKTLKILDISNDFKEVGRFIFSTPEISSVTIINSNIFVVLSTETRRVFTLKARYEK